MRSFSAKISGKAANARDKRRAPSDRARQIMSTVSRSSIPLGEPGRRHGTSRETSVPPPEVT
ncbi:Uncharacterised protein [Mycobacteroides abscessus subsp. abscessus]|nr:Uncharacterised protein [Mycobacteroides abscessus subsp. abscessus]